MIRGARRARVRTGPLLRCRELTLGYETGVAVDRVSFELYEGDYLCVVGENGSGKSTLIKGLLGLMPVKSGTIEFNGLSQREIGYLPQQTAAQKDFPASVYEVVLSGALSGSRSPFYTSAQRAKAKAVMERLGIDTLLGGSYRDLSGGQQQRALLARALLATRKLLLLDEPVTGLDPLAASELYGIIKELNRDEGITVIMVSHDVSCALHDANRVLHMGTGAVFFGTAEEYRQSDVSRPFLRCDCVTRKEG